MSDLCVTLHDGGRRALPGLRLCPGCRDRLQRDLAALPGLYERLAQALATTGTAAGKGGPRVSGSGAAPLPINPAVADHRDQIRHDLVWWCLYVADARGVNLPRNRPAAIADWLSRHVDWIAADQTGAQQCPPVMRQLTGRARALLDPDRRLATGERCRTVDADGVRCTGTITMVQAAEETWTARCNICGPQQAAAYLHDTLAGRWVTIDRVVAYALRVHGLRVAAATVRSWAARGRVSTNCDGVTTWYALSSVQRYLDQREGWEDQAG